MKDGSDVTLRTRHLARLEQETFDVLIIGAGINGAVSAAALAARGARVALIERGDFAGETSSNSSNLVWGGIKYLESGEFWLVNRLCRSRNRLMRAYPSTVREIRFLASIRDGFRKPPWLLYLGTLLYWVLGRCTTRPPHLLGPHQICSRASVIEPAGVIGGVEYSDGYLYDSDARFTFNFVRSALDHRAAVANYVESTGARRENGLWLTQARDRIGDRTLTLRARLLINACGPWVDHHNALTAAASAHRHLFSKGVHLIVDRISDSDRILTFFASDGRLFFVIPMGSKTCIGTTDTPLTTPAATVTEADRAFILANANRLLKLPRPLTCADIIAERCGVRPLAVPAGNTGAAVDWLRLSRRHAIDVDRDRGHLSIFGGKLTDCLNVGEEICAPVRALGIRLRWPDKRWYGEPAGSIKRQFLHQARLMGLDALTPPGASEPLTTRFWRRYGGHAFALLERIRQQPDSARLLIPNTEYLRAEVELAAQREMIVTLDDFLRRRSGIAQVVPPATLLACTGLADACRILFGDQAQARLDEYRRQHGITQD